MEATVQYNDYRGTTAADRCDFFVERPDIMDQSIIETFALPLNAVEYHFKGVSVYGTDVNRVSAYFFFLNRQSRKVVKVYKAGIQMQDIFNMFKRFEFLLGEHLEDIEDNLVEEIEIEE